MSQESLGVTPPRSGLYKLIAIDNNMRIFLSVIAFIVTATILCSGGMFVWGYQQYQKSGPLDETTLFIVERGQGVSYIADRLSYAGIIADPLIFRLAARITDRHKVLKTGEYEFTAHVSMEDVMEKMVRGASYQRQITIPEGLTSWQVVQLLTRTEGLEGKITVIPAEGSLLPETYNYQSGDKRQDKIRQMQQAMQAALYELKAQPQRTGNLPALSQAEAVILASIVEKETAMASERKRIAGVFINRLMKGIKLQSDPTVIYAITEGKIKDEGKGPLGRRLLKKDLGFDSPYNSYKYPGLPPGPIANPGRASIEAVLNPEKHNYLYFVADGTGGHVFARTLREHNNNVRKWRKIRKSQNRK